MFASLPSSLVSPVAVDVLLRPLVSSCSALLFVVDLCPFFFFSPSCVLLLLLDKAEDRDGLVTAF